MKEKKFIAEAVKKLLVTEFIRRETENAGFGNLTMKRTPFGTNVVLEVNKPGLVIGRRGSKIQEITQTMEREYDIESPQIEVKEAEEPDLNPQVVSKKISLSLEKGWSYRKAGNTSLMRAVDKGAKGVLIKISGKLSGERSRTQKFFYGSVKYSGEPGRAAMSKGFSIAKMKQGVIGVTVKFLDSKYRLPDDISILPVKEIISESTEPERVEKAPEVAETEISPEVAKEKEMLKVEEKLEPEKPAEPKKGDEEKVEEASKRDKTKKEKGKKTKATKEKKSTTKSRSKKTGSKATKKDLKESKKEENSEKDVKSDASKAKDSSQKPENKASEEVNGTDSKEN